MWLKNHTIKAWKAEGEGSFAGSQAGMESRLLGDSVLAMRHSWAAAPLLSCFLQLPGIYLVHEVSVNVPLQVTRTAAALTLFASYM